MTIKYLAVGTKLLLMRYNLLSKTIERGAEGTGLKKRPATWSRIKVPKPARRRERWGSQRRATRALLWPLLQGEGSSFCGHASGRRSSRYKNIGGERCPRREAMA